MVQALAFADLPTAVLLTVKRRGDIQLAGGVAGKLARRVGFVAAESEEISLVVIELSSNLIKHAGGGELRLTPIENEGRRGLEIISEDRGSGIPDVEQAVTDGFSTKGGLGAGLGTVNRLMDELEFSRNIGSGLRVICQRWIRPRKGRASARWLEFGGATRACRFMAANGDALVLQQWEGHALAGVIDGLGHGELAQRASQCARDYVEHHFDQPLLSIFRGVGRTCRATRGVVMTLARFELARESVAVGSIGNVEVILYGTGEPFKAVMPRGILGLINAPNPVITEHHWTSKSLMIIRSDGVLNGWTEAEIRYWSRYGPAALARHWLQRYGRLDDDATVLVAGGVRNSDEPGKMLIRGD